MIENCKKKNEIYYEKSKINIIYITLKRIRTAFLISGEQFLARASVSNSGYAAFCLKIPCKFKKFHHVAGVPCAPSTTDKIVDSLEKREREAYL